ncbi:MAG: hypothetical protein ABIQ93_00360 [Saprospiraceae bacterium]
MKESIGKNPKEKKVNGKSAAARLKKINAGVVMGEAQQIVSTAINVLEREVAAGIVAAKKLERKIIDVEEIRNNNPTELMSRIRQDAYAVVDLLMDAVTVVVRRLDDLSEHLGKTPQNPVAPPTSNGHIPLVKNEVGAKAGDTVEVFIALRNEDAAPAMEVAFNKSDLTDPQGNKIPAENMEVHPPLLQLGPGEESEVKITVTVPETCAPGLYSGLFQDRKNFQLCAVLTIFVE